MINECWLYNGLVMLSFLSFPFIVWFLQVFWAKFVILFMFFSKKTTHLLFKPSTLFLSSTVSLSSCPLRFSCLSKFLHCFLFSIFFFLELSWFRFRYQTVLFEYLLWFYIRFLQISLLGLQEVACCCLSCFWLAPFYESSKMISKTSPG